MFFNQLRTVAASVSALMLIAVGLGSMARALADDSKPEVAKPRAEPTLPGHVSITEKPHESLLRLTLREALAIGLENSATIRVQKTGEGGENEAKLLIVARKADQDPTQFKTLAMTIVRSIVLQYGALSLQHEQLWAREKMVELAEEVSRREGSKVTPGSATREDLKSATRREDQLRLFLKDKILEVRSAEQVLRATLGMPETGDPRIVPASRFDTQKRTKDWNACKATMLEQQPDIVQAKSLVVLAEARLAIAEHDVTLQRRLELRGADSPSKDRTTPETARSQLVKDHENLQVIIRNSTDSLARCFRECDASFAQHRTCSKLRTANEQRLKASRAFYEEGKISIDRYLDAIGMYGSAVEQEALSRSAYQTTLIALEEAQGTLLEHEQIIISRDEGTAHSGSRTH